MLSRARAARIRALHQRRGRDRSGSFLAEGVRAVGDLLDSGLDVRLAVVSPSLAKAPGGAELLERFASRAGVHEVSDGELARLAATESPQGVLAVAAIPRTELPALRPAEPAVALVLDRVQDPGNLGTLVRTADALGCRLVAALPGTADAWNPKSVRAAAGSMFRLPPVAADWPALLAWLRDNRFAVYGADADGRCLDGLPAARRAALVVGNEGAGLDERVRVDADALVAVALRGRAESLNVAAAAAILLHGLVRGSEEGR